MLNEQIEAKLREVEARLSHLDEALADQKLLARPEEYAKVARERAEVARVVDAYREYRKTAEELTEAKGLLRESDPEMRELAREEISRLEPRLEELEQRLKLLLVPADPDDVRNAILEIRAGTGGEEAALFAADLFRMYTRYAERQGWKVEIMSRSESETGGIKEVVALVSGQGVYGKLKFEAGVHRVQRVPVTESQGRIHTSAATVAVLPEAEDVDVEIDEKDLRIDVFRASGPGGQHVNTTDSAVRITHLPTGLVVVCQDEKSQHKNKAKALKVLKSRLLEMERARQHAEMQDKRRSFVKSGDRSEKIRTYNFPQDRLTDHRIGFTRHNLQAVLDGDLEELIELLMEHDRAERLRSEGMG